MLVSIYISMSIYLYIMYIYNVFTCLHLIICYFRVFKNKCGLRAFRPFFSGQYGIHLGSTKAGLFLLWNMYDGGNILLMVQKSCTHQLRLVVFFPLFSRALYTSQVVVWDFSHQQYPSEFPTFWVLFGLKVTKSIEYIPSWEPTYLILRDFWRLFSFYHDM